MATTTSTTGTTSTTSTTSSTSSATKALTANYDTFLKLLTTQLRVQNPLEPMDAEKFTEQLVSYSTVEQQIQTNKNLESILSSLSSSSMLNLVNYIGKSVEAEGSTAKLADGKATWKLNAGADAEKSTITIRNADGVVVHTETIALSNGEQSYTWDGKTDSGETATDGSYTIAVKATNADGETVSISTKTSGKVTAIDTSGSEPYLTVGSSKIPLSSVSRVSE
jgi:flagellar basal-body rod modification protein FlgD